MSDLTIPQIKALLLDRVHDLVALLVPNGVAKGNSWKATNPTRGDNKNKGNFVVSLSGDKQGGWIDFGCGDKGDILDLIAYCQIGASIPPTRDERVQAIAWAKDYLGLTNTPPAERQRLARQASARREEALREAEIERRRKQEFARGVWSSGVSMRDTLGEVYLRFRGIEARDIPNLEHSLRFVPLLRHLAGEPHVGPAMVAVFRNARGEMTGVHVTYLREDGLGKAECDRPKVMLGEVKGSVIRIARGCSGFTPEEAALEKISGPCWLTEGIEDALTVAMAMPEDRVWAVGSLSNVGQAPPLPCVSEWMVCADNDWAKPQALKALDAAVEHLRRSGRPVVVARASVGKDFNDQLMGKNDDK